MKIYQTKNNKGGRPRLADGEQRIYPVKVYFDRLNYRKLLHRHKRTGVPLSSLVYELAVNGCIKEPISKEVASYLRTLSGMANNVNQLAHIAHTHHFHIVEKENRRILEELNKIIIKISQL